MEYGTWTWGIGTVNQLFVWDSFTQIKFSKKQSSQWQKSILCDRFIKTPLGINTILPLLRDKVSAFDMRAHFINMKYEFEYDMHYILKS